MDRAEAIKVLETEITCAKQETCERIECEKCELVMPLEKVLGAFGMAIAALREQEQSQWVSVNERLPEDDHSVNKHIEGEKFGFLTVLAYNGVVKQTNRFFCNATQFGLPKTCGWEWASSNVTHWMPLPEPPKEGAEG